jgi:hypothetical protein
MFRPLKRGFQPEDIKSDTIANDTEALSNLDISLRKRRLHGSDDRPSMVDTPTRVDVQQGTFSPNVFGFADPQSMFEDVTERRSDCLYHYNIDWPFTALILYASPIWHSWL